MLWVWQNNPLYISNWIKRLFTKTTTVPSPPPNFRAEDPTNQKERTRKTGVQTNFGKSSNINTVLQEIEIGALLTIFGITCLSKWIPLNHEN